MSQNPKKRRRKERKKNNLIILKIIKYFQSLHNAQWLLIAFISIFLCLDSLVRLKH